MKRAILIDANLLVLLTVGLVRMDLIGKHRRTKGYNRSDFELLRDLLGSAPVLILLPNVVTETSNLIAGYGEPDRSKLLRQLKALVSDHAESYVASREACSSEDFLRLGVTDAALLIYDSERSEIYTDDLDLYLAAGRRAVACVYFTHEREAKGLL